MTALTLLTVLSQLGPSVMDASVFKAIPPHWTRLTEEKGERYIKDACRVGVTTFSLSQPDPDSPSRLVFEMGDDSVSYTIVKAEKTKAGFDLTAFDAAKREMHRVQLQYKDRGKGIATLSSKWDGFRGAGLYVADESKNRLKVVKEKCP